MEKKWLYTQWLMIILSAFLGALPFIGTTIFAECVFIFLIPLYYLVAQQDVELGLKEGFLWGVVFYCFYFQGIVVLIMQHGVGSYRLLAGIILIIYGALGSGFWFFLSSGLVSIFSKYSRYISITKLACWVVGSWFYFWLVDTAFFSVFGFYEGDQLRFLLLPLAIRPHWLFVGRHFTRFGGLLILLLFSASCACFLTRYKKKVFLLFALLCFLPFAAGWLFKTAENKKSEFLSTIACIIPSIEQKDPWLVHEHICDLLRICAQNKSIQCIFFPESSFQFPLHDWSRYIGSWYDCLGKNDMYIVLGSHRQNRQKLFNTLYVLHNRRIINHYDKIHTMFFTERMPIYWSYFKEIKNLFLKNKSPFCQGKKKRAPLFLPFYTSLYPYMCSDLFFEPITTTSVTTDKGTLLCLVNDSWFSVSYIPQLMFLHAMCKSLYEKRDIFYVSYTKNEYISYHGYSSKLLTIRG